MKKFRYSFTYKADSWVSFNTTIFRTIQSSGTITALDENDAKKKLKLWEKYKGIKDLKFEEVIKFSDFTAFDFAIPPIGSPVKLVRYNEDKAIVGWLKSESVVHIPYEARDENVSNFKLFKVIEL